ncbi:MAG TPA: hypothetical protein VMY87_06955 [Armatimonadota bacterium]|nr:hypothetical protein [Armatimonadota bacterium]
MRAVTSDRGGLGFCLVVLLAAAVTMFVAAPAGAEVVVYSEGFEASDGGYTHTGTLDQWAWGSPTSEPGAAHSGAKCWATNLTGDVPSNSDSYLTSGAIAVPALAADEVARVRFWAWIAVDEMLDRGEFQTSSDGITWATKAELFHRMMGDWTEYYFDVSDYADGDLYLRFRCRADYANAFEQSTFNMAGLYIDDIALTIAEAPATKATLTLEAYEDPGAYASCPWVYTWDGGQYVADNDVYSTARGAANEYRDFYKLGMPLIAQDYSYYLELRETEEEQSYTDLVQLATIDHAADVSIAPDEAGNVWTYRAPQAPASAADDMGNDLTALIATEDGQGFAGYDGATLLLDFTNVDVSNGATLVLSAQGFLADADAGDPTGHRPRIDVQTAEGGAWVTRGLFYPRWEPAVCAYDLSPYLTADRHVRLAVSSCHTGKYDLIDYVALDGAPQAPTTVTVLSPVSAAHSVNGDVLAQVSDSDGSYASMAPAESLALTFPAPALAGDVRDFVLVTEGYYLPVGSYFIYTWDGANWAQRDGWSVPGSGDATQTFDLSLWLPDPAAEFKVRIWQDFWYSSAGIDYVGLTKGSTSGTMESAYDLRKSLDVTTLLQASDNSRDAWGPGDSGYPSSRNRNRWVEVVWTGLAVNTPPTMNPVSVPNPESSTPTITWTYADAEVEPQVQYEVEVWTEAGGSGTCVWDPSVGSGTDTSVVYAGAPLVMGETYYARVKAFDGTDWGGWSESDWTRPPYTLTWVPPLHNGTSEESPDGPFKCGRTIPAKFRLLDSEGQVVPDAEAEALAPELVVFYQMLCAGGAPIDPGDSPPDAGNEFRYVADDDLFIFNLSTKDPAWVANWTYGLEVLIDGNKIGEVFFSLR